MSSLRSPFVKEQSTLLSINRLNFGNFWEFAYRISLSKRFSRLHFSSNIKFGTPGGTIRIRLAKVSCSGAG